MAGPLPRPSCGNCRRNDFDPSDLRSTAPGPSSWGGFSLGVCDLALLLPCFAKRHGGGGAAPPGPAEGRPADKLRAATEGTRAAATYCSDGYDHSTVVRPLRHAALRLAAQACAAPRSPSAQFSAATRQAEARALSPRWASISRIRAARLTLRAAAMVVSVSQNAGSSAKEVAWPDRLIDRLRRRGTRLDRDDFGLNQSKIRLTAREGQDGRG